MLHRIGNAFGWRLEVHQNGQAINLSNLDLEWYITDVRSNTLLSATLGDGLSLSLDQTQLIFDTPISALDPLERTAYAYELRILDPGGNQQLISGKFKVVKSLHLAAIEAAITEEDNLIQVRQSTEPTVIQINGNAVYGLELKADLVDGKVPASQLPSFVDDVVEYANLATFPAIGEASKIYVTLDSNLTYRWTGTAYVQISASTAIWGQISGNIALQTDLQAVFTSINAAIAGKYDNSNPAGYTTQSWVNSQGFLTSQISHADVVVDGDFGSQGIMLRGASPGTYSILTDNSADWNTAFGWGNHASAGYALSSALTSYVPYNGASANVNLGSNNLLFGTATGAGRIKLPDTGTTSSDGISFGDFFIYRSAVQTISLESSSAIWRWNAAVLSLPTNQNSTFRVGGSRTLIIDNGSGYNLAQFNMSTGTTTLRGNSAVSGWAFILENSTPISLLQVQNNGIIRFGSAQTALYSSTDRGASVNLGSSGLFLGYTHASDSPLWPIVTIGRPTNTTNAPSSGSMNMLTVIGNFAPTSGTATWSYLNIEGTINQTGSANGITRGLLIAPTLTSAVNYRAIEVTTGNNANHTLLKLNNGTLDVFCVRGDNKAGFFGKLSGQASMPAASAGATYGANEQAMLTAVYQAVRDIGIGN